MNIVFRVDTRIKSGGGHFYRCLNLARVLKGKANNIVFIIDQTNKKFKNILSFNGFNYLELNKIKLKKSYENLDFMQTSKILESQKKNDLLVVDNYNLNKNWETSIKNLVKKIMVIDDLNRSHNCDYFLNQNFTSSIKVKKRLPKNCKILLGPKYTLLNPSYQKIKKKKLKIKKILNNILIFMGSTDGAGFTLKILKIFSQEEFLKFNLNIVIGINNKNYNEIKRLSKKRKKTKIFFNLKKMGKLIEKSDIAISSGGTVIWEYIFFGIPSLILIQSYSQQSNSTYLQKKKFSLIIGKRNTGLKSLKNNIKKGLSLYNFNSPRLLSKMVDGKGSSRVKEIILRNHYEN